MTEHLYPYVCLSCRKIARRPIEYHGGPDICARCFCDLMEPQLNQPTLNGPPWFMSPGETKRSLGKAQLASSLDVIETLLNWESLYADMVRYFSIPRIIDLPPGWPEIEWPGKKNE